MGSYMCKRLLHTRTSAVCRNEALMQQRVQTQIRFSNSLQWQGMHPVLYINMTVGICTGRTIWLASSIMADGVDLSSDLPSVEAEQQHSSMLAQLTTLECPIYATEALHTLQHTES